MKLIQKSPDELERELEVMKVESEVMSKKAEIAEKQAVIKQLKREYGPNWMKILGASKLTDLHTLRSFLKSAKQGLEKAGTVPADHPMHRLRDLTVATPKGVMKA